MAGKWVSGLEPDITDLDKGIGEIEPANLAKHYERWHVPWLGHIERQRPDGVFAFWGDNSTELLLSKSVHIQLLTWYV
jgi:hypothetical protein